MKDKTNKFNKNASKRQDSDTMRRSFPILSLLLFTLGLLMGVAFFDYQPEQNEWITTLASEPQSSPNLVGYMGVTSTFWLNYLFGLGCWLIPIMLLWTAYLLMFNKVHLVNGWRISAMVLTILTLCGLLNMMQAHFLLDHSLFADSSVYPFGAGGGLGYLLFTKILESNLGLFGGTFILSITYFASLILSFSQTESPGQAFEGFVTKIIQFFKNSVKPFLVNLKHSHSLKNIVTKQLTTKVESPQKVEKILKKAEESKETEKESTAEKFEADPPKKPRITTVLKDKEDVRLKIISTEVTEKAAITLPQKRGNYIFPPQDILADPMETEGITEEEHQQTAAALIRTLAEFGIEVTPGEVRTGPVITRYEVIPAAGVRVEKIANLEKNIALALKAHSVRIIAPVPGKGTVGIEIPNRNPGSVCIKEIIQSTVWSESEAEIPVVLGKEVTGKPLVYDLTKMPHILIAGSTGAGKTVCINAIIASLLYHSSPQDLRFIMVDPKIVEMQQFNDLPHMLIPVVTNPKKVPGALKWLIKEMEHRYQIFAASNVRNLAGFNAKILKDSKEKEKAKESEKALSPEERAAIRDIEVPKDINFEVPKEKMPYIVCIIDEIADLMMVAPADIETCVARLAQLARAAGIHLILATQRPSVNVITGVIKANLPCRISFKVASKVDSRTILDVGGADQLIGRGDMLFIPPGSSNMVRAQGAYVSDAEISSLIEALKVNGPPHYADDVQREIETADEGEQELTDNNWDDNLVPAAIEVIRTSRRASTSMLQRRLKIGYNRAARIMELLEAEGIVGPENGQNPREILKDVDLVG